jgi:hypothetical protein
MLLSRLITLATLAPLAACSGGGGAEETADASIASGEIDASADVVDAAPEIDAQVDAEPTDQHFGFVAVAEASGPFPFGFVTATFADRNPIETALTVDGCGIVDDSSLPSFSAGTISVTGTAQDYDIIPSGSEPQIDYQESPEADAELFNTGDVLSISAAGATVPAFSGMVATPAAIADQTQPATVSRSSALPLTWAAGGSDQMLIYLTSEDDQSNALLACMTDDDGSFTVTPGALALLPAAHTRVSLIYWRSNVTDVPIATGNVELWGSTMAYQFNIPLED